MDKVIRTLELDKILERLAEHAKFSAGAALARQLQPTADLQEARQRVAETSEARRLLDLKPDVGVGGARDVRLAAERAARGVVLQPLELLDVQYTLVSARRLKRSVLQSAESAPILAQLARGIADLPVVVEAIEGALDDQGAVLDSASPKLARLRREMHIVRDRIYDKLQRILASTSAQYLQESIISQRGGRWVVPLQANFKGRIRGIVHDQSASGATLWIEPLVTMELNNQFREIQLQEEEEVERILAELSGLVGDASSAITWTVEALAALDLAFAKAQYAEVIRAVEPELVPFRASKGASVVPTISQHPGSAVRLIDARHPLLDPRSVVPIDVMLDDTTYIVIITGPNTGGKTVSLKTVGLLALMAQCGLHLPCAEATLSVFERVFADIGDEQSIEQSLSTFSSHMVNVVEILDQADDRSLVVLDELGAGTDPTEGAALARAILTFLRDKGVTTFVATHYPELKLYGHDTAGVTNASVEFDLETLAPTYRLRIGLAGRSNAFAIAARLGLDGDIIAQARALLSQSDVKAEDLLDSIQRARDEAEEELARRHEARSAVEEQREALRDRLRQIDLERLRILQDARIQAQSELDDFKDELARLRRQMSSAGKPVTEIRQLQQQVELVARQSLPEAEPIELPADSAEVRPIHVGDAVWVSTLKVEGRVLSLDNGQAEVQIGRLRMRTGLDELEWRQGEAKPGPTERELPQSVSRLASSGRVELDVRGERVEEALQRLDSFMDDAVLGDVPWVRIIHGKGTGRLRTAVRDALRAHPHVADLEDGKDGEGGWGVTVAHLE
jgi:DNA mismatch repair protein MutS2